MADRQSKICLHLGRRLLFHKFAVSSLGTSVEKSLGAVRTSARATYLLNRDREGVALQHR